MNISWKGLRNSWKEASSIVPGYDHQILRYVLEIKQPESIESLEEMITSTSQKGSRHIARVVHDFKVQSRKLVSPYICSMTTIYM
jgi:hypothetical protein